jgi:hypothetical protein
VRLWLLISCHKKTTLSCSSLSKSKLGLSNSSIEHFTPYSKAIHEVQPTFLMVEPLPQLPFLNRFCHCTTTERKENIFHQNLSSHIALHHYGEISLGIRAAARRRRRSKFPNQEIPQKHFVWTDDWMDDGTDDGSGRFRGCFISHPQNSSKRNQGLLHFSSPKVFIYKISS